MRLAGPCDRQDLAELHGIAGSGSGQMDGYPMTETIVVSGSMAQKPYQGGHSWVLLQYLLGLERLGWDVLFIDRLDPEMCVDSAGDLVPVEQSANLRYFLDVMERFGLNGSFALQVDRGERAIGVPRDEVVSRVRRSALLLNVMGFLDDEEILGQARQRVFVDIDPGFGQMWCDLGLHDPFEDHEAFVTVGLNVGKPACTIPTCERQWVPTLPPVVLDHWPPVNAENGRYGITSVATWRGAYGPVEYQGSTYGLRVHEFRKFVEIPTRSGRQFEIALDIHPSESDDIQLLDANDWARIDPKTVAADPWVYRDFIRASRAEFMVAKNMYVKSRSGWFSDRSACYLASGKPVLAQDTGVAAFLPTGRGLLTFSTPEDVLEGVFSLDRDYARHQRAAREIAEAYFDSDKVLSRLLCKLGVA